MQSDEDISFDTEELDRQLAEDTKRKLRRREKNRQTREWRVQKLRETLEWLLAPFGCAKCGSHHDLEVDHVDGRTWEARRLDYESRLRRYIEEWCSGIRLRWLCSRCNGHDGWERSQRNRKRGR